MALPTNNSNDPFKGINREEEIPNPFDDDDDFEEGYTLTRPQRSAPQPQNRQVNNNQGLPAPPRRQQPVARQAPPQAPIEDDAFESMSIDEVFLDDEDFNESFAQQPPARQVRQQPNQAPRPQRQQAYDDFDFTDEPLEPQARQRARIEKTAERHVSSENFDEPEESTYINEKNKKLLPFGGAKSKNSSEIGKFDSRENRKAQARAVQIGFLTLLTGATLLGLWNVINPPQGVTLNDVNAVVAANNASNGFPLDEGSAFAQSFMESFLTIDGNEAAYGDPLVKYYYTGSLDGVAPGESKVSYGSNFGQKILSGPFVFEKNAVEGDSGSFIVGALVEKYKIDAPNDPASADPAKTSEYTKWMYFNVNVYYDVDTEKMYITPDSPQLIGPNNLGTSAEIPEEKLPGIGTPATDQADGMRDVIYAYFREFGNATVDDYATLNPFTVNNPPVSVHNGFGGDYAIVGDPEEAVSFTPYVTSVANVYDVDVTVIWTDTYSLTSPTTYTSRYLLELTKNSEGDFLVSGLYTKKYRKTIAE